MGLRKFPIFEPAVAGHEHCLNGALRKAFDLAHGR